jgi:hypothetical protein
MFGLAFRRQLLLAVAAILAVVIQNAVDGGLDGGLVGPCAELGLLCLAPAAVAWSMKTYRWAAGLLAVFLTLGAIQAVVGGYGNFVPVAIVGWLTLMPIRWSPSGKTSDVWLFAGLWRARRTSASRA